MTRHSLLMATAAAFLAMPALAADPEFMVLDWAGFEDEGLFADYTAKYGTGPTYSFFGDDDEAFQKVDSGFKTDVVHPCSQMVGKYRDAGLIEPWDTSKIPQFANIDPKFLASPTFKDDSGVWYIPTDFGATAITYNTTEVPAEDVSTLQVFLDAKYQGRTSLPDNADDVWALALLATGVTDWSNVTDEQFKAAADWLREAHKNVSAYWSDPSEVAQLVASGQVLVAWTWNDAVALLREEGFPVGFQREPKEGSSTWFCGYVNIKDGPGKEDKAYDFINSWIRPEAGQVLLDGFGYGPANTAEMATLDPAQVAEAGVGPISAPILAQIPIDLAVREKMVEEFEKIKAGF